MAEKRCFVCHGMEHVSEMTDGRSSHTVCDSCRELVNAFFFIYGSLNEAVREVTKAKRGSRD